MNYQSAQFRHVNDPLFREGPANRVEETINDIAREHIANHAKLKSIVDARRVHVDPVGYDRALLACDDSESRLLCLLEDLTNADVKLLAKALAL